MEIKDIITQIISKEGSPTYVFSISSLKSRIKSIKAILGDNIKLCYSIKANPFVITDLVDLVDNLEVCSPGELDICKSVISDKLSKIIYSGVSKTSANLTDAYDAGVGVYTAESIAQVEILNEIAQKNNKILPVLPRLNSGSQFGMSKEDITYIIHNRSTLFSNVDIVGIHYFAGTQRANKEYKKQKNELEMLEYFFKEIKEQESFTLKKLEYGPGLPVPVFETDNFEDTLSPLKELIDTLKHVSTWAELTVEMGRFIATECGYYVTRLLEKKSVGDSNYAIFDGGINHVNYIGQIMGMKVPLVHHLDKDGNLITDQSEEWNICGSLCTTNDNLIRAYKTSNMEVGDYLVFCNIGAYSVTEGLYLFLSRTLPKIITVDSDFNYKIKRDSIEASGINTPQ